MKNILENIQVLFENEKYDEAIEVIKNLLTNNEQIIHPQFLVLEGMCIQLSENPKYKLASAKKLFEKALQLDKNYENALIELAYYNLNIENNAEEAIKLFKQAMVINNLKLDEIKTGLNECAVELEMENAELIHDNKKDTEYNSGQSN